MRPIRLPDTHLPGIANGWTCRSCSTPWPCAFAGDYLGPGRCSCGQGTYWEKRGARRWHPGERCYTDLDVVQRQAADVRAYREAHPHYPPSHSYPPKPSRRARQRPPYRHTPTGPGDIQPGTWTWVQPGGLHPSWGDIHQLAMVAAVGSPKCEVWLILDGTMHDTCADLLILDRSGRIGWPDWARWTLVEHLAHRVAREPAPASTPVQPGLFEALMPV